MGGRGAAIGFSGRGINRKAREAADGKRVEFEIFVRNQRGKGFGGETITGTKHTIDGIHVAIHRSNLPSEKNKYWEVSDLATGASIIRSTYGAKTKQEAIIYAQERIEQVGGTNKFKQAARDAMKKQEQYVSNGKFKKNFTSK